MKKNLQSLTFDLFVYSFVVTIFDKHLKLETMKTITEVTFKNDITKVKFLSNQTLDLRYANKMMETDFSGMGYDPNFDAGVDGFANYLHEFTTSKWSDFSQDQIKVIKDIFCL